MNVPRPVIGVALAVIVAGTATLGLVAVVVGTSSPAQSPIAEATVPPTPSPTAVPTPTPTPRPLPPPAPTATPAPTPEPTPTPVPAPLTGRLVSPSVARRHPIAVMIDDLSPARPQSGLHLASVVWHAPAEGGIPRYMAIFQDQLPTDIGPVRSARSYYIAWAAEWKAVYVHSGGSPQALATLRARGHGQYVYNADHFRYGRTHFRRTSDRFSPHNVYTDGKTLRKLGKLVGAKDKALKPAWRFAPDAPLAKRPVGGTIRVSYRANTVTYKYHRASNTYRRSVTGEGKQVDAADGKRIAPKNVVVMIMTFIATGDSKHRLEGDVLGSGRAYISTNGRTIEGTWKKSSMTKPTRFYDEDGEPVTLTVGQTFIQVMPRGAPIFIEDGKKAPPEPPPAATRPPLPDPTGG